MTNRHFFLTIRQIALTYCRIFLIIRRMYYNSYNIGMNFVLKPFYAYMWSFVFGVDHTASTQISNTHTHKGINGFQTK